MRELDVQTIETAVCEMCIKANCILPDDLVACIRCAAAKEPDDFPKEIMNDLINNLDAAEELNIPICQDTGMTVVFADIGQDVHITGGDFEEAINNGVRKGYMFGKLRCSIVKDPLNRVNTGDNTPAVIHTRIVKGDKIKLTVSPKGFGSENMSRIKMFNPSCGKKDIIEFVVNTVINAGSNPCPPVVLGIGIGGDFEYCALLAKKALCRPVSVKSENIYYREFEDELLKKINSLDIGPQGFGGKTTALSVAIEVAPTHIAGLPVAINVGCHVTRHSTAIL